MSARGSTATTDLVAPAPLKKTWDIATTLTPVGYYPKSGILPAIIEVRDQTGDWRSTGQTRQLMLSDGSSVIEHTTDVDRPTFFAYNLSDFTKLFGLIVASGRAEWTYSEVAGGTNIHWTYTFHAKRGAGWIIALIVRLLWAPYMRKVLPRIVAEVERQASGGAEVTPT